MKTTKIIVAAIVVIAFGLPSCGGGGILKSESPSDVVKKVFSLMNNQNYDKIAEYYIKKNGEKLTEEETKKLEGLMAMASAEQTKKGGVKEIVIVEETIDSENNTAKVKYKIVYNNDKETTESTKLMKVADKWYMSL
jgi:hypothetical protein